MHALPGCLSWLPPLVSVESILGYSCVFVLQITILTALADFIDTDDTACRDAALEIIRDSCPRGSVFVPVVSRLIAAGSSDVQHAATRLTALFAATDERQLLGLSSGHLAGFLMYGCLRCMLRMLCTVR